MARVLYFDCFSGISGDMALGALIDAGLPLDALKSALGSLAVAGFEIATERVLRAGVSATKFIVREHPAPGTEHPAPSTQHGTRHSAPDTGHPHRHLPAIFKLVDQSALSGAGKDRAKAMFQRLAEVEPGIHQM